MTKNGSATKPESPAPRLSIVVPVYNEAESITEFATQLKSVLDGMALTYEVLFVDDGSDDRSVELIHAAGWREARVISFVLNAGHMAALDAGYRASRGDFVISLDSDLQHPPELIPDLFAEAVGKSVDVVYAARRTRERDSIFKRVTALTYYRGMRGLTGLDLQNSAADFRLISQRVVTVIRSLPVGRQVFRLLIPSLGFTSSTIYYTAAARFAGKSKYTLSKMINLSSESVIGFTTKPLTISIRIGLFVSLLAVIGFVYVIVTYFTGQALEGWASVLSTVLLMFGLLFVVLGVFGMYLATLVNASRARPLYIVAERAPDGTPSAGLAVPGND